MRTRLVTYQNTEIANMNKRALSRKPFLFYNEDVIYETPKRVFRSDKIKFEKLNKRATSATACKMILVAFFDYCLPKWYRRKPKYDLIFRILEPVIKQAGTSVLATVTNGQHEKLEIFQMSSWEMHDNKCAHKWLIKVAGTNFDQQMLFIVKQIAKKFKTCNLGFFSYYKLFRRCLSVLILHHKNVFVQCLQIILKAAMPIKNRGVIKSNYAVWVTNALHYYIVDNMRLLCTDINVLVQVRRLLIKHYMLPTEGKIEMLLSECCKGFEISLREKLLCTHMMRINDDNLQWPSLANNKKIVEWNDSRYVDESNIFKRIYTQHYFIDRPIKTGQFKYYGWDEHQRWRRTESFCVLTNLQINKDGSKKLKRVKSKMF